MDYRQSSQLNLKSSLGFSYHKREMVTKYSKKRIVDTLCLNNEENMEWCPYETDTISKSSMQFSTKCMTLICCLHESSNLLQNLLTIYSFKKKRNFPKAKRRRFCINQCNIMVCFNINLNCRFLLWKDLGWKSLRRNVDKEKIFQP